ncbi:MAG TPA: hypothetical protein VMY99_02260 [Nevskiaceae bacterium]|nr:hypothetical protein [Nevskiaceae bacterium]
MNKLRRTEKPNKYPRGWSVAAAGALVLSTVVGCKVGESPLNFPTLLDKSVRYDVIDCAKFPGGTVAVSLALDGKSRERVVGDADTNLKPPELRQGVQFKVSKPHGKAAVRIRPMEGPDIKWSGVPAEQGFDVNPLVSGGSQSHSNILQRTELHDGTRFAVVGFACDGAATAVQLHDGTLRTDTFFDASLADHKGAIRSY